MPVAIPGLPRTAASIVDLIGNTPLIRLSAFEAGLRNVELYAKAEWRNPGGSVKDRAAARMILEGERSGALTRDKIILDATSGNTGIAYAMIGAARGYRVRLCVPSNVTPERKRILQGVRRGRRVHRSDAGIGRRDPPRQGNLRSRARTSTSTRTSTTTTATGARTTTPRRRKSSSRPADGSRISSRVSDQRHVRRRGPAAARVQPGHPADFRAARFAAARPRRAEAHGDGDRAGHLRRRRWPTRTSASAPRKRSS